MSRNHLQELVECGQSPWLDYIRRSFITGGDLRRLVDEDFLGGVTSNPTIFEKAIAGSSDYDEQLRDLASRGQSVEDVFKEIAATDVQMAADVLRPVYNRAKGRDGFVSVEVSPEAAHDTEKTLADARFFWRRIDRPNVMIKVPATPEGIPAIEQLISEGINVNITLIFAVEVHDQVMEAFVRGLERRVEAGHDIDGIASVASFFVSRVDTLVDKLLDAKAKDLGEDEKAAVLALQGKAAIANAKIAYEHFQRMFGSERFQALKARGAQVQRPLWASTSTKNPKYPDTLYVDSLIGPDTVNTMPQQTLVAAKDHAVVNCGAVTHDVEGAHQYFDNLARTGIQMKEVTSQLTREGVDLFADSLHKLFDAIQREMALIEAGTAAKSQASLDGQQAAVDTIFKEMDENQFLQRLWEKDPSIWKPASADQSEITNRLGWLHVSDCMLENRKEFTEIAEYVRARGFKHAVVLGMGGSSLAPYVFAQSFGKQQGFPELLVLDSTDPEAVCGIAKMIDPARTLFLVSTKSGTTTETLSFFKTFWESVRAVAGDRAGEQFVAITDPDTSLVMLAQDHNFHHCFLNPADIGGRYSALSYFGLIPAAVMGVDVERILDRALKMEHACAASIPSSQNPGAWLGAVLAGLAKEHRDKVTFFLAEPLESLGLWLEQLLAESTGKEGTGLVPVPDNPVGSPASYADDHLFVTISVSGEQDASMRDRVDALARAGQPVVRLEMADLYDLGAEFFRWEFATAVAGGLLHINAFDQPNVQESKDNTKRLLQTYERDGSLPEPRPLARDGGLSVSVNEVAEPWISGESTVEGVLRGFLSHVKAPEYLAIMAYIEPSAANDRVLQPLRAEIRDHYRVAVTLGYGPRFLHSTGQLHKGGPPEGVFLQITSGVTSDVPVPEETYTYGTLIASQALGDFQSLGKHGRPALRLHIQDESVSSLEGVRRIVESAMQATPAAG